MVMARCQPAFAIFTARKKSSLRFFQNCLQYILKMDHFCVHVEENNFFLHKLNSCWVIILIGAKRCQGIPKEFDLLLKLPLDLM